MFEIRKQISGLYTSSVLGNLSLTGAWVAILAARGYSLFEIGIAETVFHITSLIFEIPSGVLADVFGRKKMLIVSSVMRMIGNIIMILSCNLFMVCMSIAFHALSYNFASGSGDALAYDSLKMAKRENEFVRYESNQLIIYRLCSGVSTLCAGFALFIGYKIAYGTDLLVSIIQIFVLESLCEVCAGKSESIREKEALREIDRGLLRCFGDSLRFLKKAKKALGLMLCNSLVGAVDILLLFFLQAKLPQKGISEWGLGFALLFMEMGGIVGAKLILKASKLRYRRVFAIAVLLVMGGLLAEHSGMYLLMTLGGFVAAIGDDALQVRTNTMLQDMFPSEQRATLISVESFMFSVVMIILSPLAGIIFSYW